MNQAIETALGGIVSGALFALVALGFTVVFSVTGVLNLSQGAYVVLGALLTYTLEVQDHWPVPVAVLGTLIVAGVVSAVIERFVIRRASRVQPMSGLLILTAGLLTVFEGAALLIWGTQPYALPPFSGETPLVFGGVGLSRQAVWLLAITAVLLAITWWLLTRTTFGKALRACAENPLAANLMGIDVPRMSLFAFATGGVVGALGGAVAAPLISLEFDSGSYFSNQGFIAVALGGMGSYLGSIAGGLVLGLVEQLTAGYISSLFSNSFAFLVLLIVLVVRPAGLLGRATRREDTAGATASMGSSFHPSARTGWLLGLVGAVVILVLPRWLEPAGLTAGFVISGLFFIAVIGLDLVMGFNGQVALGQAAFMAIGAYSASVAVVKLHWPSLVGIGLGLAVSLVAALVLALITMRLRGLYLALATLGFGLLVDTLTVGMTDITGGPSGMVGIPSLEVAGHTFASPVENYYLVWIIAGVLILISANLVRSGFGRALMAIRADPTAARALGIRVPLYKAAAFLISAAFASLAGSLYAFNFHFIAPDLVNTSRSLEMVTMLIVGGEATLLGPLFGALLVTLLPTMAQGFAQYKTLAEGVLLVLIMLYLPGGILGGIAAFVNRLRTSRRAEAPSVALAES